MALSPDKSLRGHFHGTPACLAALYRAEGYGELIDVLKAETFWPYERWAVKALGVLHKRAEAVRFAECSRGPWTSDGDVDALCEEMLLSSGLVDDAYTRYALRASGERGGDVSRHLPRRCREVPARASRGDPRRPRRSDPGRRGQVVHGRQGARAPASTSRAVLPPSSSRGDVRRQWSARLRSIDALPGAPGWSPWGRIGRILCTRGSSGPWSRSCSTARLAHRSRS